MTQPNSQLFRFMIASGMSNLADGIAVVVWAWIASLLTRDPFWIAMMPIALRLPWFVFALPAGVVTDRTDRRRLILVMDIVRAIAFAAATLSVALSLPFVEPTADGIAMPGLFSALLACAFIVGTAEVFRDNAAQTILPALVPHDQLEKANGRLWSVELVGNALLGPALGAFLIASIVWLPFFANTLAFALSAAIVFSLRGTFTSERPQDQNWKVELGQGLAFLRDAPLLRLLAVITGIWNLLHQMMVIALILYVQEVLNLGAQAYGLILASGAIGGIAGGFCADPIIRRLGAARCAQWTTFASAVAFAVIPFAPNGIALAVVLAAFEFTGLIWNTVSVSYRQRSIPNALLGRVNSVYRLLAWGMMPIGLLLSGLIVRWFDTIVPRTEALSMPFYAAAIGAFLLTAIAWRPIGKGFKASFDRAA